MSDDDAPEPPRLKTLNFVEHCRLRPDAYAGSTVPDKYPIFSPRLGIKYSETLTPGFRTMVSEVLCNAYDACVRSSHVCSIKASVCASSGTITVKSSGEGINADEVVKAFSQERSSTNYDDSVARTVGGRNGVGVKMTNALSEMFEVHVADSGSSKIVHALWANGVLQKDTAKPLQTKGYRYVKVVFKPSMQHLGMDGFGEDARLFVEASIDRLALALRLAAKPVKVNDRVPDDFCWRPPGISADTRNLSLHIMPVKTPHVATCIYVNGVECTEGSAHGFVDTVIARALSVSLPGATERMVAKEIRNRAQILAFVTIVKPQWADGCKSRLVNAVQTWRGEIGELPADFAARMRDAFVRDVEDALRRKIQSKALRIQTRERQCEAHLGDPNCDDAEYAAAGNCADALYVVEGDSAKAFVVASRTRADVARNGIYKLTGKPPNVIANRDLLRAFASLRSMAGLGPGKKKRYSRIVLLSDQDVDGVHICGLVLAWLCVEHAEDLRRQDVRVQRMNTPLMNIDGVWHFSDVGIDTRDARRAQYFKGLGSHDVPSIAAVMRQRAALTTTFTNLEDGKLMARIMFSNEDRKERKEFVKAASSLIAARGTRGVLKTQTASDFLSIDVACALWQQNTRMLPGVDGLIDVRRKLVYAMRDVRGELKVVDAVSRMMTRCGYNHGETSAHCALMRMMCVHPGSNNVAVFAARGIPGSRVKKDGGASARYLHVLRSAMFDAIFPPELLRYQDVADTPGNLPGVGCPEVLACVLPFCLLNHTDMIGAGFSFRCYPRDPLVLVQAAKEWLNGTETWKARVNSPPWFWGSSCPTSFTGLRWSQTATYYVERNTVRVVDLPCGRYTDEFVLACRRRRAVSRISNSSSNDHVDVLIELADDRLLGNKAPPFDTASVMRNAAERRCGNTDALEAWSKKHLHRYPDVERELALTSPVLTETLSFVEGCTIRTGASAPDFFDAHMKSFLRIIRQVHERRAEDERRQEECDKHVLRVAETFPSIPTDVPEHILRRPMHEFIDALRCPIARKTEVDTDVVGAAHRYIDAFASAFKHTVLKHELGHITRGTKRKNACA